MRVRTQQTFKKEAVLAFLDVSLGTLIRIIVYNGQINNMCSSSSSAVTQNTHSLCRTVTVAMQIIAKKEVHQAKMKH